MLRASILPALMLACGCSSEPFAIRATLQIVTGTEADTWTTAPAPARLEVRSVVGENHSLLGTAELPGGTYDLPDTSLVEVVAFEVVGFDAAGAEVVRGRTIRYAGATLGGATIPVFAGRAGAFSRPGSALDHPHRHASAGIAFGRYVVTAGGDAPGADPAVPDLYDLGSWQTLRAQPAFPSVPRSMAIVGSDVLLVGDAKAGFIDLSDDTLADAAAVANLDYGEVSGGDTIVAPDGTTYVVGATRITAPATTKVLRISADGLTATAVVLASPRLGAAAAFVTGLGLVVAGGGAEGAASVEIAAAGSSTFTPQPELGTDRTAGGALIGLATGRVLLVGGVDPATKAAPAPRTIDLHCTSDCAPSPVGSAAVALDRAHAFMAGATRVLAVGDAPDGTTGAILLDLDAGTTTQIPLRVPRSGATPVLLPNGKILAITGGIAPDGSPAGDLEVFPVAP